jgi:prophage antirepressor-like protein
MDNSLTLFDFNSQSIRVLTINNEPWFVAQDICRVLEIKNVSDAIKRIDAEDLDDIDLNDTIGRQQNYTAINESGFYSLVLGSRKLVAKPFKRWVTKGFQTKNEKRKSRKDAAYLPSGEGAEFSDLTLVTGSDKDSTTYQQLRWYSSVLEVLKA